MQTIIDHPALKFDNLKRVVREHWGSGDQIVFEFTNGSKIAVCCDNDGVHFYRDGEKGDPTIGLLVDVGSGMMSDEDPPHVWVGQGTEYKTVQK